MSYKPPYTITPKITNLVAQISEAIGSYYAHENLRLHRVNRIKTIHGTLAIEGNTLSTEQVTAVLEGKPVVAPINEVQEVRNALKAYELLDTLDPCKVDDLLKAHATMEAGLIDEIGCFRKGGAGVVSGKTVIHYAPDAERVPFLVNDLFEWLRTTDEHPLIASCVFHYEFEFIHPFADGNGRTGRLWQTLILSRWRPIFKNLPIENIVYKYQKEYYKAIAVSGGKAGCTPFVEFILGVIAETLTTQETTRKTTQEIILEAIARNPSITRAEFCTVMYRYLGLSGGGDKVFDDTENHWAKDYVSALAANGIVGGVSDALFDPDAQITREQIAVILDRAFALSDQETEARFNDDAAISAWAYDNVYHVLAAGYMKGDENNNFSPGNPATRAEVATIIYRLHSGNQ